MTTTTNSEQRQKPHARLASSSSAPNVFCPPPALIPTCPISRDTLTNPITLPCGHSFNKDSISQWFNQSQKCPACQMAYLKRPNMQSNYVLRDLIEALMEWVGALDASNRNTIASSLFPAPPAHFTQTQWIQAGKSPSDLLPNGTPHRLLHDTYMHSSITHKELKKLYKSPQYRMWKLKYTLKSLLKALWDHFWMLLVAGVLVTFAWVLGSHVAYSFSRTHYNIQELKIERMQHMVWECTPLEAWNTQRLQQWSLLHNYPQLMDYVAHHQITGAQISELGTHTLHNIVGITDPLKQKALLKSIRAQSAVMNSHLCQHMHRDPYLYSLEVVKQQSTFVDMPRLEMLYRLFFKRYQVRTVLGLSSGSGGGSSTGDAALAAGAPPMSYKEQLPLTIVVSFLLFPRLTTVALLLMWKPTLWVFSSVLQFSFLLPDFAFWMDAFVFQPKNFWRNAFVRIAVRVVIFNLPWVGGYIFVLRYTVMSVLGVVQIYFHMKHVWRAVRAAWITESSVGTFVVALYASYRARNQEDHVF